MTMTTIDTKQDQATETHAPNPSARGAGQRRRRARPPERHGTRAASPTRPSS